MIPRVFAALLMGAGPETRRPRRRFTDRISFQTDEHASHPSQGVFVVDGSDGSTPATRIQVTPVHPGTRALADEAMALSAAEPSPAPDSHSPETPADE